MSDFGDGGHASSIVNSSQNWCFHVFMEVRFLVDFGMTSGVILGVVLVSFWYLVVKNAIQNGVREFATFSKGRPW